MRLICLSVSLLGAMLIASPSGGQDLERDAPPPQLTVVNDTERTVQVLQISPTGDSMWGPDRLGPSTVIEAAGVHTVVLADGGDQCVYDVRVVFDFGEEGEFMEHDVCQEPQLLVRTDAVSEDTESSDSVLTIVNGSRDQDLFVLFVSSRDETSWGPDRLGDEVLAPGAEFQVRLATGESGCVYDVLAQYSLFGTGREYQLDVCRTDRLVVEPRGDPSRDPEVAVGTAFYVVPDGKLVTNHHVVDGCEAIEVLRHNSQGGTVRTAARVVAHDRDLDLAILSVDIEGEAVEFARLRALPKVRLAESATTFGFPEGDYMSKQGVASTGVVAALSGGADGLHQYQTTAPVHPGNSGGPLLDSGGLVIGVLAARRGETVAYAVKSKLATAFLEAWGIQFVEAAMGEPKSPADIVEMAQRYVVPVTCSGR